jgi:ketosteroid isomerase-like protein
VTVAASNTTEENQIRVLIEDRVKAARAKDAVALVANHAPEVVTFDVVNPLQNTRADAVKQRAERWFASFHGPISAMLSDKQGALHETTPSRTQARHLVMAHSALDP